MSSYPGGGGAWDGGPPGAEAEYGQPSQYAAPPARPMPSTDPWTGVSYSHYAAPSNYDYQAYGAGYAYNYDSNYYQRPDGSYAKYSESQPPYPPAPPAGYEYPSRPRERTRSPIASRKSSKSRSRSASPYERKERPYSKKRDSSYEVRGRHRSRSKSTRPKRRYSSSDRSSSRSHSYSRSLLRRDKKKIRSSVSSNSTISDCSYKKLSRGRKRSTPPKSKSRSHSRKRSRTPSLKRSSSKSPRLRIKVENEKSKPVAHSSKETRVGGKKEKIKQKDSKTPPRKRTEGTPPRGPSKSKRSSLTPPKNYNKDSSVTPPRSYKIKDRNPATPPRKRRDNSLTPPKSYARSRSSSSNSRSKSPSPRRDKHKRHVRKSRSRSSSSASSHSSKSSRLKSKRTKRRSPSQHESRSESKSKRRSVSRSKSRRSKSRGRRSASPRASKSRSKSRTPRSRSASHASSPSDEEIRRGQFTVADRKRFWKLHKSRQEERDKDRTPPKEVKPPPGAVEPTHIYDVEYGVPPEVEGPNFAELLPAADPMYAPASSSKSKAIPLPIKNDGSFLEMFKKMQEATKKVDEEKKPVIKKPTLPFIGKRRGGRVLKTGLVKKAKAIDEQTVDNAPKDAWSLYMQEVKKYRETSCEEERKTRPLVK